MDFVEANFSHYSEEGRALIRSAYDIAQEALFEDRRDNGHPFLEHPVNVALIVSDEMGLPADCVTAVFLHEATRKHPDVDIFSAKFPDDVYTMVDGLNKISTIKPKDTRLEAENYKKLIVQYSKDPRVTVIKIADRLEIMRQFEMFPKASRERKILETLLLYIPLAHQLGLYNIKSELENIYFRFAEPEQYRSITNKLKATQKDREKISQEFVEPLKKALSDAGIKYKFKIRTKTAYSIYKKMLKQGVPFEGVYDVYALRFIIDCDTDPKVEKDICWQVYSYVTAEYEPDTKRLRDWITNPKPNGYESLHITVKNKDNSYIEVQIRTKRMDDEAENGHASHWSYKGIRHEATMDKWLTSVRYALEHPDRSNPDDLPQPPSKEIFVFTPTGELKTLPAGASVLDFAYGIHSNLGNKCSGGKINGKVCSIREKLSTGDLVEVISGKNQKPASDWINYVVTSKARSKIRQALNEEEFKKANNGRELLSRRLKNWKLEFPDDLVAELMKKHHIPTVTAFYAAINDEVVDVNAVKTFILEHDAMVAQAAADAKAAGAIMNEASLARWSAGNSSSSGDDILVINAKDIKGLDYRMARCCNPVFGDDVFGFVTRTEGVKIHRMSCPNASRLIEQYPYRIQKMKWAETPSSGSFQSTLKISASSESSVIAKIMEITGMFKASIRSFTVNRNEKNGTDDIMMKISVPSNMELDKVMSQIKVTKGVLRVIRQ